MKRCVPRAGDMLSVVFDTVVFVRSLMNPHSRWGDAAFSYSNRYRLFLSQPVLAEILEVLQRPELTRKFRSLKTMDMSKTIEILGQAEVAEVGEIPPASRDVKDNKFLATARAAAADYLVTEDDDLLVLQEYAGAKIVNTANFLRILEREDG